MVVRDLVRPVFLTFLGVGAALSVMMDCQKTLKKVARVKAKEMKPMRMEAREMGARTEWDIVTPIEKAGLQGRRRLEGVIRM
jgi:hypothetical protein